MAKKPSAAGDSALAAKAVLTGVKIRRWTGRALDKRATDEFNQGQEAAPDAGRYNKHLLPKEAFASINSVRSMARQTHYVMTLPWLDDGVRILPSMLYDEFSKRFRGYKEAFDKAAEEFCTDYPKYLGDAKKRLGKLYDEEDYPHPRQLRRMFSLEYYLLPYPDKKDFRISITEEQLAGVRSEFEDRMGSTLKEAMRDPYRRILAVVGHMAEKLKGYQPRGAKNNKTTGHFRDSLVENVQELVGLLPAFNLTNDPELAALTVKMEKELCAQDASTLREDPKVRKAVAASAEAILKRASELLA